MLKVRVRKTWSNKVNAAVNYVTYRQPVKCIVSVTFMLSQSEPLKSLSVGNSQDYYVVLYE